MASVWTNGQLVMVDNLITDIVAMWKLCERKKMHGIMGEPLCQPLCILHDFNKCFVNICICICDGVFCKQTCKKAGEDRICILIAFVFQKYEKAQQAFCVQYWFPKSSHQKPTFCKISNLLCLLKSPISIECAKSDRLSPAWVDTGGYLLPAAYWVPSPPSVELESDPSPVNNIVSHRCRNVVSCCIVGWPDPVLPALVRLG